MILRLALFEFSVTTRPRIPPKKDASRLPATLTYGYLIISGKIDGHLSSPLKLLHHSPHHPVQSSQPKRTAGKNGASTPLRLKTIVNGPQSKTA